MNDHDELAAFLAGAFVAAWFIALYMLTRPPKTSYLSRGPIPVPPLSPHCWGCDVEARELEQFGHTHMPQKRTPTVAPAARGK
jgi:hypothetical protein